MNYSSHHTTQTTRTDTPARSAPKYWQFPEGRSRNSAIRNEKGRAGGEAHGSRSEKPQIHQPNRPQPARSAAGSSAARTSWANVDAVLCAHSGLEIVRTWCPYPGMTAVTTKI